MAMEYDLTEPCGSCPFRNDGKGVKLSSERAEEILFASSFQCHKTITYLEDEDGEDYARPDSGKHCAGQMILLEHMEQPNQMMRICERIGLYDMRKLNMNAPIFDNEDDFLDHHDY